MWRESVTIGQRRISLETGRIARQAESAVLVRDGGTVLLVAVSAAEAARSGIGFFPLTVEYREKFSAAGRFPGGYRKREGRIADHEILSSRLVDRTIRPLFAKGFTVETQVLVTVLSYDPETDPEVLAISGAAAALQRSSLPWAGPVAGVRVAEVDGALVAMPSPAERARATLDLVVSAGPSGLVMVEGQAAEASEASVVAALLFAQETVAPLCKLMDEMRGATGVERRPIVQEGPAEELVAQVLALAGDPLREAAAIADKRERRERIAEVRDVVVETLAGGESGDGGNGGEAAGEATANPAAIETLLDDLLSAVVRERILAAGRRIDGRGPADIRPISGEVGWLPRAHGSSLFTRGETQAMVTCTLGTGGDEQEVENLDGVRSERFLLFYNFPPYSVGEVRPLRGPGRREIGHGNLAHRALAAVLPAPLAFPYTIKVESEISESNGSSSMATVCGGALALMDAGVPVARPVAGVAMGLIMDGERVAILSDILGDEDHLGDMDFKVAGTERGITAVQMDNKLGSLPREVLERALEQARAGRLHVLGEMAKVLAAPRPDLAPHAPRIAVEKIRRNRIRDLIGPGGRIIQELQAETGTKIDVDDDGTVRIAAPGGAGLDAALAKVRELCGEPEVGRVYRGAVTGVKDFGVFVRVMGSIEGLVHASELTGAGEIGEGDAMDVRVLGVDDRGRLKLARVASGT